MITRGRKRRLSPQDEEINTIKPKRTRGRSRPTVASPSEQVNKQQEDNSKTRSLRKHSNIIRPSTPGRANSQTDQLDSTTASSPFTRKTRHKNRRRSSSSLLQDTNLNENTLMAKEKEQYQSVTRKRKRKQLIMDTDRSSSPRSSTESKSTTTTTPKSITTTVKLPAPASKPIIATPQLKLSVKNKPGRPPKRHKLPPGRPKKKHKDDNNDEGGGGGGQLLETLMDEAKFYRTFGHKLTETESNTNRGAPSDKDKELFIMAKSVAEV